VGSVVESIFSALTFVSPAQENDRNCNKLCTDETAAARRKYIAIIGSPGPCNAEVFPAE